MVKILSGATGLCVLLVLLGINRGFDITDEGLYALLADPLQQNVAGIFNYDLFFKLIYRVTGYTFSLVELRLFRLITYLAGAWALAGFWKNVSCEPKIRAEIFWISCLGLFSGYAFLPPTLSYNSLTLVLICFWLFIISKPLQNLTSTLVLGIILALLVYIKVSLALIFFPLTFSLLIFWQKGKMLHSLGIFLPLVVLEFIFFSLFGENSLSRLQEGIPLNSQRSGYGVFLMVKNIAVGGIWITLVGALFFGIGYLQKAKSSLYTAFQIITAYGVITIGYFTHITDEWNHLVLLLSAAFLGFQMGTGNFKPSKTNFWILLLLILPFLLHFGSNVYWLRIGVIYLVFWILAFKWIFQYLNWEVSLISALVVVLLVFNGIWWQPFGQDQPLWSPKTTWNMGDKGDLQIDPQLAIISKKLQASLSEPTQKSVLAAYRVPGLMWLAGRQIPFSPGIWDKPQLDAFFETKPEKMIFHNLESLPQNWSFVHQKEVGVFQGDTLRLLWD